MITHLIMDNPKVMGRGGQSKTRKLNSYTASQQMVEQIN